jgi:uncharacterized Rmd1/YagE family protein
MVFLLYFNVLVLCRFFLEVLHNQKSTKLELIIILLIAGEMVIGLLGLSIQLS